MNFIPVVWEKALLDDAEKRIDGAADYAEKIGDPLQEAPAMRQLVVDIRDRLNDIQK
jgi:hypothetical protein